MDYLINLIGEVGVFICLGFLGVFTLGLAVWNEIGIKRDKEEEENENRLKED